MPGLDPGIHLPVPAPQQTWIAGSSPAMTSESTGNDKRLRREALE